MALPLIFNADPRQPLQLNMEGSAGAGGKNRPDDTVFIQALLNAVPIPSGGSTTKLKADGKCGPLTITAIKGFQSRNCRLVDGRIDVGKSTIKALVNLLQQRNAVPSGLSGFVRPHPALIAALGAAPPPIASRPARFSIGAEAPDDDVIPMKYDRKTDWCFAGSSGGSVGIGRWGITHMQLKLKNDKEPGKIRVLNFTGPGAGFSVSPFAAGGSGANHPGTGFRIYRGLTGLNTAFDSLSDFAPGAAIIITIEANAVPVDVPAGAGLTWVAFGLANFASVYLGRAYGFLIGTSSGIANLGITAYAGVLTKGD